MKAHCFILRLVNKFRYESLLSDKWKPAYTAHSQLCSCIALALIVIVVAAEYHSFTSNFKTTVLRLTEE